MRNNGRSLVRGNGLPVGSMFPKSLETDSFFRSSLLDEIERVFDFIGENSNKQRLVDWCKNDIEYPKTNVYKDENHLAFDFFIPGLKKENINLEYEPETKILSLSYNETDEEKKEDKQFIYRENRVKTFSRKFNLSEYDLGDEKEIQTKLEDGILKVSIPLREKVEEKPKKLQLTVE